MKRILSIFFVGLFIVSLAALTLFAQTANDIVAEMVKAQGGEELFKSIKDMTMTGTIELVQQGLSGSLTIYKKEPDKRRLDVEVMGMVFTQAYDGAIAWWTNPQTGAVEEMNEQQTAEIKRQALPIVSILIPEKYGLSFTYKGKEQIEGKDYFVLEETFADGFKATLYVDTKTYLVYKSKAATIGPYGNEVEVEEITTDYRKIGGMNFPQLITSYYDGQEYSVVTIGEVTFNKGLEDSLFKME